MPDCRLSPRVRRRFQALAILGLLAAEAGHTLAAEQVTITMNSGATFTGTIDPLTDARLLWLRSERGAMRLRRPLDWNAIAQAQLAGRTLSADELRAEQTQYVQAAETRPRGTARDSRTEQIALPPSSTVATLRMDAAAANWDADVENDGILLQLAPIGTDGAVVPVSGTLEVELIGQGPATPTFAQSFPLLGRWVRQLTPADMQAGGYTFRLDYQALQPEFDMQLGPSAMVHARLVVPGRGAFEVSSPTINVRPFHPLRDQLQMQRTGRFFPTEQTGVGKHP